jgi:hypothetical protein
MKVLDAADIMKASSELPMKTGQGSVDDRVHHLFPVTNKNHKIATVG